MVNSMLSYFVLFKKKQAKANTPSNSLNWLQILRCHQLAAAGWALVSPEPLLMWGWADSEAAALPAGKELLQHRAPWSSETQQGAWSWSGFELCVSSQGEAGAPTFSCCSASSLRAYYTCSLEQLVKSSSPWEGPMLEEFMEDHLQWERSHAAAGEECEQSAPWGARNGRDHVWWTHNSAMPGLPVRLRRRGERQGVKLNPGKSWDEGVVF